MVGFLERERLFMKSRWARALALLTCLLMVLVVAEQGLTIDKQRNLIQLLWDDSKQLTRIRIQELAKQREKIYTTDPHYGAPAPNAPADTPTVPDNKNAPDGKNGPGRKTRPAPKADPAPPPTPPKPARVLWHI
jgi:hypothetical protein